jgi:hypothetical protein
MMTDWLKQNKFKIHLTAFTLMVLTSIGMIFAENNAAAALIWGLLAVFVLANLLAMFVK